MKFPHHDPVEHQLMKTCELTNQVREDTIQDLESLCADFRHNSLVVQSIQRNYQALLDQNQQLKTLLLSLVKDCYCWEGNRCKNCQKILTALGQNVPPASTPSTEKYQDIVEQLRKLG